MGTSLQLVPLPILSSLLQAAVLLHLGNGRKYILPIRLWGVNSLVAKSNMADHIL
jgi:hypothetical protein